MAKVRKYGERKTKVVELYNSIQNAIKELSLDRLKAVSGLDDITIDASKLEKMTQGHWVVLMTTSWHGIRLLVSCHFTTEVANALVIKKLGGDRHKAKEIHDFMAEFCNLTVGGIKSALSTLIPQFLNVPNEFKVVLPDKRADYELDASRSGRMDMNQTTSWSLVFPGGAVSISSTLELKEKELLDGIEGGIEKLTEAICNYKIKGEGEVEFF